MKKTHLFRLLFRSIICIIQFSLWKKVVNEKVTPDTLCINLKAEQLHRYVECMINLLEQDANQVTIILPLNISLLSELHLGRNWRPYNTRLLTRENVLFAVQKNKFNWIEISIDYFNSQLKENFFKIPIGPHPLFWTWRLPENIPRVNTVFFSGSLDTTYGSFNERFWKMPSRISTINFLQTSNIKIQISNYQDPQEYLFKLKSHNFFLCLPGLHMPICHSLYEALYLGCIPITNQNYWHLLDAELQSILSPFTWSSHESLEENLLKCEHYDNSLLTETRQLMAKYCMSSLHPGTLLKNIRSSKKLLICAEEKSFSSPEKNN